MWGEDARGRCGAVWHRVATSHGALPPNFPAMHLVGPAHRLSCLPPSPSPLLQMVSNLRSRPEVRARGRERTHLLLLYSALCGCITCKEARVREMVKDVLLLAGAEIGVGMPLPAVPSRRTSTASGVAFGAPLGSVPASVAGSVAGSRRTSSISESHTHA